MREGERQMEMEMRMQNDERQNGEEEEVEGEMSKKEQKKEAPFPARRGGRPFGLVSIITRAFGQRPHEVQIVRLTFPVGGTGQKRNGRFLFVDV